MATKKQIVLPLVILLIAVLIFGGLYFFKSPPKEKKAKNKLPVVTVQHIEMKPLTLTVNSYGLAQPKYETEMVAQVAGTIVELSPLFVKGGFVQKGDLLARIDPSDYQAALIGAQADLASAQAALEQERAQGKVAEDEWTRIEHTKPTELSLRKPQLAKEQAKVKSAQAAMLVAQRNLERTEFRAPYDAIIESRHIGLGSFVRSGTAIGTLLGTDVVEVRLPVATNQFRYLIDEGANAPVKLSAEYAGALHTWQAQVVRSEGVVDKESRMTYLVAEVEDPYLLDETSDNDNHDILKFGTYLNAEVQGIEVSSATKVSRHLVASNKVPTLGAGNLIHFQTIDILRQDEGEVIVTAGLKTGDLLITSALDYPFEGMKVTLPKKKNKEIKAQALKDRATDTDNLAAKDAQ